MKSTPQIIMVVITGYATIDTAGGGDEVGRLRFPAQTIFAG